MVNQAHEILLHPDYVAPIPPPHDMVGAFMAMMESTVIINLVIFLFPLSYILLVYGNSKRYGSIASVPTRLEFAIGLGIMVFSFFTSIITTRIKATSGGYGVTDFLVFLMGLSYLFFGYDRLRGVFRRGTAKEKKPFPLDFLSRIDIAFYFLISMEIIYIAYQSKLFESEIIKRLEPFEASIVANTLHLFGYPITAHGNVIAVASLSSPGGMCYFTIAEGCTGIISITIYSVLGSALILTVPAKAWKKAVCIIGGVILLFFANLLRLITIMLLGYYKGYGPAMDFHMYGGYIYFMLFVGIFWFVSLNYFLLPRKKEKIPKSVKDIEPKLAGAKKFTIDVGWVMTTLVVSMAVGLVLKVLIANHYGTGELGIYSLLLVIYMLSYTIGELGISATITKFIAEKKYDPKLLRRYSSTAFINSVINGIILFVVVFILATPISWIFKYPQLENMLRVVAFVFPFMTMNSTIIGIFNGLRQMEKYSICGIFRRLIVVVFTALFIVLSRDIMGAVIALVLAELYTFIIALYFGSDLLFPLDRSGFKNTTKKLWGYSVAVVSLNVAGQLEYRIDLIILALYALQDTTIGIYTVAVTFAWLLPMIPRAMQTITFPMIARYKSKNDMVSMERLINLCLKFSLILMILLSFILIFIGPGIISILFKDKNISEAYIPMVILTLGLVIYGMVTSIGGAFLGIGKPSVSAKISLLIMFPMLIIGNIILIPLIGKYGIPPLGISAGSLGMMTGASIAVITSYITSSLVNLILLKKYTGIKIIWKEMGLIIVAMFCSIFTILFLHRFVNIFLSFAAGLLVFGLILHLLNVISREEKGIIRSVIKSFIG
jgi:exosortase/archaeosortase family protein